MVKHPILPKTFSLLVTGAVVASDDGNGNIVGAGVTGTVDYSTGISSSTFSVAPANAAAITTNYTTLPSIVPGGIARDAFHPGHSKIRLRGLGGPCLVEMLLMADTDLLNMATADDK